MFGDKVGEEGRVGEEILCGRANDSIDEDLGRGGGQGSLRRIWEMETLNENIKARAKSYPVSIASEWMHSGGEEGMQGYREFVLGAHDDLLFLVGHCLVDALENVLSRRRETLQLVNGRRRVTQTINCGDDLQMDEGERRYTCG